MYEHTNINTNINTKMNVNILKLDPFKKLHAYLVKETNERYREIVNNFLCDIWAVLSQNERCNLNQQITPELLGSFYLKISLCIDKSLDSRTNKMVPSKSHLSMASGISENPDMSDFSNNNIKSGLSVERTSNSFSSTSYGAGETHRRDHLGTGNICMARTSLGRQCTRTRKRIGKRSSNLYYDLCASHINSNPYGLIGGPNPHEEQKRQRDFQNKLHKGTKGADLSQYIRTTEIEFEGTHYLLDEYGVFYRPYDLIIVGKIDDGKIYWYQ